MKTTGPRTAEPAKSPRLGLLLAVVVPAIVASVALYALVWNGVYWGPPALALLLGAAIVYSTLRESELRMGGVAISGNVIPFFAAVELAGPLVAGLTLTATHLGLNLRRRRSAGIVASNVLSDLLVALMAAGVLALAGGLLGSQSGEPLHLVALIVAGFSADSACVLMHLGLTRLETGERPRDGWLKPYLGIARILVIGMLMTAAVVWVYQQGGLTALAVALVALPVFYELVERINQIENELRIERDRNARYLAVAGSMFLVLDRDGRITLINERGAELLGRPESDLVGADWFGLTAPPDEVDVRRAEFERRLHHGGEPGRSEATLAVPGGERVVTWNTTILRGDDGRASGMLVSSEDVTARRRAEARVAYLAYHDQLTGLANRAAFEQSLVHALEGASATGTALALYFLDVDGFKSINDELGHAAGDELLRQIAGRLRDVVRGDDLVVRQGGDEFLLLSRVGRERLPANVETVRERVEAVFAMPFELEGRTLSVSVSTGVAVYPDDALDAETLVRRADDDMYRAKRRSGRARIAAAR
ncbi:MAG: GGDEF domain-containing protein [Actinomycetota bacterium]|nr:GGDEF domain-containing protein [Actinomycetota bacterium]